MPINLPDHWMGSLAAYHRLSFYDRGEPVASYQMNRLSLRNNRLNFKTAGKLPIVLEEFIEYYTPI